MDTNITGATHAAAYDAATGTVRLSGIMRLNGMTEYAPVVALLSRSIAEHQSVTVDLTALEFLNSSGIAVLSKFVIEARNKSVALTIRAARAVPWQSKSLVNLQRLMPALVMDFV
ncbi:slr1659 superfamily regulator [Caenispirillum bisanense]|uniref:slr1659 superfamily regulator n=1 Tax=Caenispirillum bisanense TaxID=414052 RepID=UPI0031DCD856